MEKNAGSSSLIEGYTNDFTRKLDYPSRDEDKIQILIGYLGHIQLVTVPVFDGVADPINNIANLDQSHVCVV